MKFAVQQSSLVIYVEECPSCCHRSSGNHARTQIDLCLRAHLLNRLHALPSCCILLTSFCKCWWPPSTRKGWMYAPSSLQRPKYEVIVIEIHIFRLKVPNTMFAAALGPLFYTAGTSGLKHHPSSTFHRRKP